jgi:hypothetical protein
MIPAKGFWTGAGDGSSRGGAALGSRVISHALIRRPPVLPPSTQARTLGLTHRLLR